MNDEYLIECIQSEIESGSFDFKKDIYDFSISENKQAFLIDVLSFANGHSNGDKYIITGVKLYPDGSRDLVGITETKIKDGADYQNLINDNIEPNIILDFKVIEYEDNKYGIFRISKENDDKPYLLSKKYYNLEKGFIRIRKGQKNEYISRRDFDIYYKNKFSVETSNIYLRGIIDKNLSVKYCAKKYTHNIDFKTMQTQIYYKFEKINNYNFIKSSNTSFRFGDKLEFNQTETKNIRLYAMNNNISIDKEFFDLGDLSYLNIGIGTKNLIGTDEEKEKYELIEELEEYTGIYNGLYQFYNEINNYYFLELAIENNGKKFDDDIEVNLKIKRECFLEYVDFPVPSESIIEKILDDGIIDKLIRIEKINGINCYTAKDIHIEPIRPILYKIPGPLGYVKPDYKEYSDYYIEYIKSVADFEIISDKDYYYIQYEQKNIKPNEKILLPARLMFKQIPEYIEYEIKTKHNPKILTGKIEKENYEK